MTFTTAPMPDMRWFVELRSHNLSAGQEPTNEGVSGTALWLHVERSSQRCGNTVRWMKDVVSWRMIRTVVRSGARFSGVRSCDCAGSQRWLGRLCGMGVSPGLQRLLFGKVSVSTAGYPKSIHPITCTSTIRKFSRQEFSNLS